MTLIYNECRTKPGLKFLVHKFAWRRKYFENRGKERSVILKLVFKEKAGRLLNSVVLFRLAMSD
jgi:hypothetical protein